MSYYNKNWLYPEYKQLFEEFTGTEPTEEEKIFLQQYFNPYEENGGKNIYYMAVFRLKRGWYKALVYFFICKSLKKDFKKAENMQTLVKLHKVFAKRMLENAIKYPINTSYLKNINSQ